ncbi:transposase [Candidatus Heimdallarchaeota archaeon B3_Heim]|nr:MAG: transposase [Candidatus Heimdallarchaeota archaeon B3_Heim]
MTDQVRVIRTERIWLKSNPILGHLCHISKNLFNETNYLVRQSYFTSGKRIKGIDLRNNLQDSLNFRSLPQVTALKIIAVVEEAWKSFFAAVADWKRHPEKYFKQPRPPRYKDKAGEFLLWYSKAQIKSIADLLVIPQASNLTLKPRIASYQTMLGIRIIPQGVGYIAEILYAKYVPAIPKGKPTRVVGIDLGLTNLITMVNNIGKEPIAVKGGVVKSINQYYNKERVHLHSIYSRQEIGNGDKLRKLTAKRKRKLRNHFHEVSSSVTRWCQQHSIDAVVIGHNKLWKQHINLGKRVNQNFVSIPFDWFLNQLKYKLNDVGIRVICVNESYTSKCSFLDVESISQKPTYKGERITRGLYLSSQGRIINSDVNGGYNILKKAVPNAFSMNETVDGIEGVWLHPVRLKQTLATS